MKKSVFLPVITIAAFAVLLLGLSFGLQGVGKARAESEHLRLLQTLLPDSKNFTVEEYTGDDANIRSVHKGENGYVIETVTNGYADDIRMLIGVSNKGTVTGLVVMEMYETFGLGADALTNHRFLAQFLNTSGDTEIGTNVDALSGATVTSKAITRSILSAVAFVTGADVESGATSWGE